MGFPHAKKTIEDLDKSFELKSTKEEGKTPNQHLKSTSMVRTHIQMAY